MLGRTVERGRVVPVPALVPLRAAPGHRQYWFSDNVWHDAKAELPWASDLRSSTTRTSSSPGLRTLTPYLDLRGRRALRVPRRGRADNDADQAMLDQAKQDGDDVAGAPGVSMHTDTAMDYIDEHPRLFRGSACYTTVPAINVVAEKHYAWALPIAAGIATNRERRPVGLPRLGERRLQVAAVRPRPVDGVRPPGGQRRRVHLHVDPRGEPLPRPRAPARLDRRDANADGSPRYYDGFTWAYNSTAAPSTYSHTELVYSILDQENIARGHTAYYLKWTDEALSEGGEAYASRGVTQVGLLPADAARLRQRGDRRLEAAETLFARFDFVNATFAAQKAWRSAAAYRDLALGLRPARELRRAPRS